MKTNQFILTLLLFSLSSLSCIEAKTVIETQEKIDLSLTSNQKNPQNNLISIIDLTETSFGKRELNNILVNPTTDRSIITKRQKLIRYLINHPETRKTLTKHLKTISDYEEYMNLFIQYQESPMHNEILKIIFFCNSLIEEHCPALLETLNENELALTLRHYIPADIIIPIFDIFVFHWAKKAIEDKFRHRKNGKKSCCSLDVDDDAPAIIKIICNLLEILHGAFQGVNLVDGTSRAIDRHAIINIIHEQVSTTMHCVTAMNKVHSILESLDFIPTQKTCNYKLLEDLTNQLESLEAPQETNSLFLPVGNILVGYKKLLAALPDISNLCEEIGIIDAHLSTAKLIENHEQKTHKYCFVDFAEKNEPTFIAQNLWNPMLSNYSPVTNNINFGEQLPKKLVITGPNKAGKTSAMKAVALNAILAQSFGIAAADSAIISPFEKVITYVHLNDDITQDQSMFVAEVLRADYCFKTLQENKEKPVLLLIDDSLFKSTNSVRGEQLAYDFIKTLKDFDKGLILVATHFPLLTTLEAQTNRAFTNYHIHLEQDAQRHLHSTYKLEVGSDIEHDSFALINETNVMQGLCCN